MQQTWRIKKDIYNQLNIIRKDIKLQKKFEKKKELRDTLVI